MCDYTDNKHSLVCFQNRKGGSDAAHLLVQHGLPRLAISVSQRSWRTHPGFYGEYESIILY